ncbi:hypothetical protein F511_27249 [Dorcoceras hygrometricum]|uniref:Uncharacterized protein n=1 Tax=Dorcoceras hygrometricum TaxID=472368 RepID=A0A2Z7DD04_9LAMI|nr:hypothetical protein F511_27249 [Dorcoceras hygrometricum]
MVKRLATSRHDPLSITDSACKNQLVVVSIQYGPFNTYIPIRSTTIGKSRVAIDPVAMHTSWRSNSDIASVTRVSMTFRVVRTNQYNQDLGLNHSTNGNHLESPNEGSSIDHQVTIHLHAQNITMFPTNKTCWSIFTLALQLIDVIFFLSFDQHLLSTSDQLLLLSSTTDQTSHFRMRPVLFPPKRSNEQDSLLRNLIHLTAAQLLMTSRLLKSSISLDDVTTAETFNC